MKIPDDFELLRILLWIYMIAGSLIVLASAAGLVYLVLTFWRCMNGS